MFKKKELKEVVWEATLKCNAKCIHCGSAAGDSRRDELSTEEALNLCDQLAKMDCKKLNLIGGEFLLRKDWKEILKRLDEHKIPCTIITNAIALNKEKIDFLKNANLRSLSISVDGAKPETHDHIRQSPGLFDKIFNIVVYMEEVGFKPVAITTLTKINLLELQSIRENLINSPFKAWQIQLATPHGRMTEKLKLDIFEYYIASIFFAKSRLVIPKDDLAIVCCDDFGYYSKIIPRHAGYAKWKGCSAGKGVIGIRSDGKIQGCLSVYHDEFIEGDLKDKPLEDIYNSRKFCKWNKRLNKYFSLKGFCKSCEYALICIAGCSDMAYALTGRVGENTQCHHAIESHWKDATPENKFEEIFKEITQGRMDEEGNFYLQSGEQLTKEFVSTLEIDDDRKKLLELVC